MSTVTSPEIRRLGRYEILGDLATGGMAEILLGRVVGPADFERVVVIKRILPHLAKVQSFVDMFVDEARIVAGLRHPNIIHVHELVREGSELFLVMEYLEGETLGSLLRRLRARGEYLDRALAAYIVAEACAGLHAAHELVDADGIARQLVHRDIKPGNVVITYDGQIKVLDFGIAKASDRASHTDVGMVKGTFGYMSPEQCEGKPLDRRSDIFSLGTLLWEASTSKRLFDRPSDLLVFKAICEDPIPRPSHHARDYPRELEDICMRALERRRANRYTTAAEMRRDLLAAMRTISAVDVPDEALAELMHHHFAERIDEKRDMLRRVRSGGIPDRLPTAEIEDLVRDAPHELPASAASTETPVVRRSRARTVGLVLVMIIAACVAGWQLSRELGESSPEVAVPAPPPRIEPAGGVSVAPSARGIPGDEPAAESEDVAASEPLAAHDVVVTIETVPAGARVVIDGNPRGVTPLELRVPRGTEPLRVSLTRAGFAPLHETIVPEVDQKLRLTLAKRRSGAAAHEPARRAKQREPDKPREFPRFQ